MNVTIVEVINHNQIFNFNQMEQGLNQTNQQLPQTLAEPLINSPRPSRSTNSCTTDTSVVSPRQASRHHQTRIPDIEESVNGAMSSSHLESNDQIINSDDVPQRSITEISNEGQQIKIRMAEPEDVRLRRKPKRQEVIPPATDQEVTNNYEHLVLPTVLQSRPPPALSNFVPTDIILPARPQVKFNYYFIL